MVWYINDLSLREQYSSADAFLEDLRQLMRLRQTMPILGKEMYCSRRLHACLVSPGTNFRQAVQAVNDRDLVNQVLEWINKRGPFWDDVRQPNADDYFECHGQDVTEQGLGEVSRRQIVGRSAKSFSFLGSGFDYSPLEVVHGLPEEPINRLFIDNIWQLADLKDSALGYIPFPVNWKQMLNVAQVRFDKLFFSPDCINSLKAEPFSKYVVERAFELLGVLQEFMICLDDENSYSDRKNELLNQHFVGRKAWFTSESPIDKQDLSFPDPDKPGTKVFCPWHGKIKSPQYRIHFEWPVESRSKIRIFYIGPKITKR